MSVPAALSRLMRLCGVSRQRVARLATSRACVASMTASGFGREGLARRIAFYKSVAINLGANIVRRELKLPEAEIPAADPRFTFAN